MITQKNKVKTSDCNIPVVILCGGEGTRLREETEFKPKPMVEIGGRPILWHIMKIYAYYGFQRFILCLGYKDEMIKEYFLNYRAIGNDFTIELGTNKIDIHDSKQKENWKVSLVDTGRATMTGARVKKIEKYIDSDLFMLTYGDGVANIDVKALLEFHKSHRKIGTITGVLPSSRWGELLIKGNQVTDFSEKPQVTSKNHQSFINGGFFVFNKQFFKYLSKDENFYLEKEPLEKLAADKELIVYRHTGFWQCMDTYREYVLLNKLWEGERPWAVWEKKS